MQNQTFSGRLPDLHHAPKPRWQDAIRALMRPATRLHDYRNLHRRMFYDAMCELDCRNRT